jgi:spore photoproduct lyase
MNMESFVPSQVFFEPEALDYNLGKHLVEHSRQIKVPVKATSSHNRVTGITGNSATQKYREAKRTLVIGVRRSKSFQTCKPSAHYQLPLATSCPGMCEYCYLATTLGQKPYLRIYVNVDEILGTAKELINMRSPEITIFEGAATSDPLPVEKYTGSLKKAINFFGEQPDGRFRFVTKFTEVESLLDAKHNGHTRFRFSLNCEEVIRQFEHGTPTARERIEAARKVFQAGYPLGFIIAPIFRFENWEEQYANLFRLLEENLTSNASGNWTSEQLTFEFITHRFTNRAKSNITSIFPQTQLPMDESSRKFKFGQFGYGKYLYQPNEMDELKAFFLQLTNEHFPGAGIEYFV